MLFDVLDQIFHFMYRHYYPSLIIYYSNIKREFISFEHFLFTFLFVVIIYFFWSFCSIVMKVLIDEENNQDLSCLSF